MAASFYGEAWALLGAFGDDSPFGVRWSLGLAWRPTRGWGGRVGTSVDVLNGRSSGSAVGIETQVERVFGPQRTLGLRLALARGEGDGSTATLDGTSLSAGLRVQVDPLLLGVDGIVVRGEESTGTGALLGIGVGERPGRYVIAVSAVGAVIGGLFLAALSQSSIH